MTFRYRDQRGSLEASMKTVVELADRAALIKHLREEYEYIETMSHLGGLPRVNDATVTVEWYGYDSRIDWQTYLVSIDDRAVGFTDGPVT